MLINYFILVFYSAYLPSKPVYNNMQGVIKKDL